MAVASVVSLVLSGCSSSGGTAAGASAPAQGGSGSSGGASSSTSSCAKIDKPVFMAELPLTSLSYAPLMVADAKGFFKAQCLDPSFQVVKGSAPAIQAVITGKGLLSWTGLSATMEANGKGAPVVTIGIKGANTQSFVSGSKSPIRKGADFKGKLIGLPSAAGGSAETLQIVLSAAGVDSADVKTQVVGLAPGVYQLVEAGRIAGYSVSLDTAVLLKREHKDAVVFRPSNPAMQLTYITSESQANNPAKADEIRRFLKAIYNAEKFIASDQSDNFARTIELIQSKYEVPTLDDKSIRANVLKQYVQTATFQGANNMLRVVPKSWDAAYETLVKAGLVKSGLDPAKWFTNKFSPTSG
jgi:NitT/TauT family transport system substrate-binding protein